MQQQPILIDKLSTLEDGDQKDSLLIKGSQYIPSDYLSDLRKIREGSLSTRAGEFHRIAAIPVAVVDKWKREGFDIYRSNAKEILKRLREEGLDGFITSNKVF